MFPKHFCLFQAAQFDEMQSYKNNVIMFLGNKWKILEKA